jgi:hypothetical protein
MKYCFSFLMFFGLATYSIAQSQNELDARIYDMYPSSKLDWMIANDPNGIQELNLLLNAYELLTLDEVEIDISTLQSLSLSSSENINIISLGVGPLKGKEQWIYLTVQNTLLHIYSQEVALSSFKQILND